MQNCSAYMDGVYVTRCVPGRPGEEQMPVPGSLALLVQ